MEDEWNDRLTQLWEQEFTIEDNVLQPLHVAPLDHNGLLFIGLNPSFHEARLNQALASNHFAGANIPQPINARQLFGWAPGADMPREVCFMLQAYSRAHYGYYQFHRELTYGRELNWQQIDLYRYRCSSAHELDQVLTAKPNLETVSIQIFEEMLTHIAPQAIVVLNASVARKLEDLFETEYDQELGHNWVTVGGKRIPALFSGQIGRSMSADNRRMLEWCARRFLDAYI